MSDQPGTSDEELLRLAREAPEGDTRPFEELVRRHQRGVVTNCVYLSGSPTDSEDLAQEVFVKAYFGLARFEGRATFKTWLHKIKANHCINFVKKKRLRTVDVASSAIESVASPEPTAEREVDQGADRARIESVLLEMSETLRVPLVLRDMDGMAYEDIADQLGIGLSAVKMRIKRGREEFRRLYSSEPPSPG